ncbi:MAG TPA: hypothetical protein VLV82_05985, partial [Candidatus Angelobacter sp.]|nr:hypothetical protein [Candidatus Angelobacter sp.]
YPNSSCPHDPGNWYILKCPGENAPSNAELVYNTLNGCKEEVGTIPQWDTTHTPWTPLDTATVNDSITTQCEAAASATLLNPTDCLQANPGNKMNNLTSEWRTLLTKPSITLPVFNGDWNLYAGSNAAGCSTTGSNVCYPVQALATVKVCGFWFGNGANQHAYDVGADVPGGLCPGVGADIALNPPTGPGANELWLTLVPNGYQLQGTSGPSGIALGQGFGVDGTRLIR